MSLMGTLAKVAVGMAVAKGMKSITGGGGRSSGGGGLGDLLGQLAGGKSSAGRSSGGGGLGDLLGQLAGGKSRSGGGGLGDILGQLGGAAAGGKQSGGGLGDLLGQLTGGGSSSKRGGGGLENIMGDVFNKAPSKDAGGIGGLGGLLDSLSGKGANAGTGAGGMGDMLNQSFEQFGEPKAAPTAEQDEAAGVMLKSMLQAAMSDGRIDAAEKEALFKNLGDISKDEMAFVNEVMKSPVDPKALAREVPRGAEAQTYMMSLIAIDLDSDVEAEYLNKFAVALGLEEKQVNQIHEQMNEPALYG